MKNTLLSIIDAVFGVLLVSLCIVAYSVFISRVSFWVDMKTAPAEIVEMLAMSEADA